jgi:RNA polymerase sigma-70 factor (ECF subfamily)
MNLDSIKSAEPPSSLVEASRLAEVEMIARAQQGDSAAFEWLFRQHSPKVYRLCLRMLKDKVAAEDLTQEAFLRVFRNIASFRGESAFSTWLHRIAVNAVLMHLRKNGQQKFSSSPPAENGDGWRAPRCEDCVPDLRLERLVDRLAINRPLESMPAGYKRVLVLHDIEGYQHNEIAAILGCSTGTSKSQLHKARGLMGKLLTAPATGQ